MVANRFDLTNQYAIEQGATYDRLSLFLPDNVANWTPYGQIRRDFAYRDEVAIALFGFQPLQYREVELQGELVNRTIITPYLTDEQTLLLPVPKTRREGEEYKPGKNCWVYDFKIESNSGEVVKLQWGYVDVIPDVTRK